MQRSRLIAKNFFSLMLGEAGYMLLRLAAVIFLARMLLVEGFGRLNFAIALVTYFTLLVNLGINELGVREVSRRPESVDEYVGSITTLRSVLAVAAFSLLVLVCRLAGLARPDTALVLVVGGILFTYAWSVEWAFRGLEKMGTVGRARALSSLVYLVAVVALIRGEGDLLVVAVCLVGAEAASVAYLYMSYGRSIGRFRPRFDLEKWKELLRHGWPIGLAFAMSTSFFQVDMILLGLMKDETAVGLYSAAGRLITIFYTLSIVYVSAIFPQLSKRAKETPGELREFLVQTSRVAMVVVIPLGLLATLLAQPILNLVYGAYYLGAVRAFQVLIWSLVVFVVGHLLSYSLVGQDRQKAYLGVLTLGAVVNLVLNLACIGPFGILGSAFAKLAAQIIVLVVAYILLNQGLGFSLTREFARTAAAAAVMGAGMLLAVGWPLPMVVGLAVILYLGALVLVQGVTSTDVRLIRELVFPQ